MSRTHVGEILEPPTNAIAELFFFQCGLCAVCRQRDKNLVVDHDHGSGLIRGILCYGCNSKESKASFRHEPGFVTYRKEPPASRLSLQVPYTAYMNDRAALRAMVSSYDLKQYRDLHHLELFLPQALWWTR